MSDEKVLTKEIAEQFRAEEDSWDLSEPVYLEEFNAIEDAAARLLSYSPAELDFSGLMSLSDDAAQSLGMHSGELILGGHAVDHEGGSRVVLIEVSPKQAASLSAHPHLTITLKTNSTAQEEEIISELVRSGNWPMIQINVDGESPVDQNRAQMLCKYKANYFIDMPEGLTDSIASALSKHEGKLWFVGFDEISDAAAESLAAHRGTLDIEEVTKMSETAARCLLKHEGKLIVSSYGLTKSAAAILRKHPSFADED